MTSQTEQAIISVAEGMIRRGGYNNFSFRNIADEIGIKSSSVHYHFATKGDLGAAVTRNYTDQFLQNLGQIDKLRAAGKNPIAVFVAAFRTALVEDKAMCLCGVLGTEAQILPEAVLQETRRFFRENQQWLQTAYEHNSVTSVAREKSMLTLSTLEGAMVLANLMDDVSVFDEAVQSIVSE